MDIHAGSVEDVLRDYSEWINSVDGSVSSVEALPASTEAEVILHTPTFYVCIPM